MKTLLLTTLAVAFGGLGIAQSVAQRFEVPFAFHVGNKRLPPGEYVVQEQFHGGAIFVSSAGQGNGGAFAFSHGVGNPNGPKLSTARLVFTKYADGEYFLAQAWSANWNRGLEASKSKAERLHARNELAVRRAETVNIQASAK